MNDWLNASLVKQTKGPYGSADFIRKEFVVRVSKSKPVRKSGYFLCTITVWVRGHGWIFGRAASSFDTGHIDVRVREVIQALLDGMPIGAALDLLMEVLPEDDTLCVAMAKILGV